MQTRPLSPHRGRGATYLASSVVQPPPTVAFIPRPEPYGIMQAAPPTAPATYCTPSGAASAAAAAAASAAAAAAVPCHERAPHGPCPDALTSRSRPWRDRSPSPNHAFNPGFAATADNPAAAVPASAVTAANVATVANMGGCGSVGVPQTAPAHVGSPHAIATNLGSVGTASVGSAGLGLERPAPGSTGALVGSTGGLCGSTGSAGRPGSASALAAGNVSTRTPGVPVGLGFGDDVALRTSLAGGPPASLSPMRSSAQPPVEPEYAPDTLRRQLDRRRAQLETMQQRLAQLSRECDNLGREPS